MPNFICKNENCAYYNKSQFVHKVKFKFSKEGNLIPLEEVYCMECYNPMVLEQTFVRTNINKLNIGSFKGMNEYDKRRHIKKRAKDHYEKHDKERARITKNEMINKMKEGLQS